MEGLQLSVFFNTCPLCDKSFTREASFNRHVKYCQKARNLRKGRPRACVACNSSKAKCNFATPQCARCERKSLECIYVSQHQPNGYFQTVSLHDSNARVTEAVPILNEAAAVTSQQDWQGLELSQHVCDSSPQNFQTQIDHGFLNPNNVGLDSFEDFIGGVVEWADSQEPTTTQRKPAQINSLISSTDYIIAKARATKALTPLNQENPSSRQAANIISRMVSAFPHMMLRRHTFPPFIHPYWHQDGVPQNLASCMSIAQLFVSRTTDTRSFLWRTIEAEQKHLLDRKHAFTRAELQQAIQAVTIYIVMAIIDQDEDTPSRGAHLMKTFIELKLQLQLLIGGDFVISETEAANPSLTWDDWIFAESRRRIGCLWFAITRVFALKTDRAQCSSMDDFYNLPLPSSKPIWEARTGEDWEHEKCLDQVSCPLATFGELLVAQGALEIPLELTQ
ncbi:hypothetical protein TrVFT333_010686 [Trichoderma virens FT-333]|nr:hypothetical protein TrVFT333_010686 [Trichoderma virens FT-333]